MRWKSLFGEDGDHSLKNRRSKAVNRLYLCSFKSDLYGCFAYISVVKLQTCPKTFEKPCDSTGVRRIFSCSTWLPMSMASPGTPKNGWEKWRHSELVRTPPICLKKSNFFECISIVYIFDKYVTKMIDKADFSNYQNSVLRFVLFKKVCETSAGQQDKLHLGVFSGSLQSPGRQSNCCESTCWVLLSVLTVCLLKFHQKNSEPWFLDFKFSFFLKR